MRKASFPVSLAVGAALAIAAQPAAAQVSRDGVARGEMAPPEEQRLRRAKDSKPQTASADHELTHTVQQRPGTAGERSPGSESGIRHQQGRVIADTDYNASAPPGQPPSTAEVSDGTSKTVLVSERPAAPAPASQGAPPSGNPFMPEVDDEVLVSIENGDYSFSGDYVVVAVRHRAPVRLGPGRYRSPGGSIVSIGNGRIVVHGPGDTSRPVIIGTVPNPSSAPAQPASSQPQQTDFEFVRERASDGAAGAGEVTVRGWDAKDKKSAADDDAPHPGPGTDKGRTDFPF